MSLSVAKDKLPILSAGPECILHRQRWSIEAVIAALLMCCFPYTGLCRYYAQMWCWGCVRPCVNLAWERFRKSAFCVLL